MRQIDYLTKPQKYENIVVQGSLKTKKPVSSEHELFGVF